MRREEGLEAGVGAEGVPHDPRRHEDGCRMIQGGRSEAVPWFTRHQDRPGL